MEQSVQLFLQQLINGVQLGSIYALVAVGYTMVYGVLQFINFAHGDVYMVGAFMGLFAVTGFTLEKADRQAMVVVLTMVLIVGWRAWRCPQGWRLWLLYPLNTLYCRLGFHWRANRR